MISYELGELWADHITFDDHVQRFEPVELGMNYERNKGRLQEEKGLSRQIRGAEQGMKKQEYWICKVMWIVQRSLLLQETMEFHILFTFAKSSFRLARG